MDLSAYLNDRSAPQPNGCRLWTLGVNDDGYGVCNLKGKRYYAHRLSYEQANGPLLKGEVVRHTCDNPACINPAHLVKGSQKENVSDMLQRQRGNLKRASVGASVSSPSTPQGS